MDEQLLQEFLAEAEDLIEVLFGDIQTLRARQAEGRARRELVGRIFRHVHTFKGSSSAVGLDATSRLAHEFESLLEAIRMGRVVVDDAVLDAFEDAAQSIAVSLGAAARRADEPSPPPQLLKRLRDLTERVQSPSASADRDAALHDALAALPEEIKQNLSEYELRRVGETAGEGARLYVIKTAFGFETFDEQFRNLSDTLSEGGEILSTLPDVEAGAPDHVSFRVLYATEEALPGVAARIAPFKAEIVEAARQDSRADAERRDDGDAARRGSADAEAATGTADLVTSDAGGDEAGASSEEGEAASAAFAPEEAEEAGARESLPASAAALTALVRVPLDVLDDLISSTHELFTDTVAALELARDAAQDRAPDLETRAKSIRRRLFELEERLINLRMVPVGGVLERVARAGRSVARDAGKEVDFEIAGGGVRLDKSLADALAEPLLHLLRNAVDHGVELPEERRAMGKPARGRVRIAASSDGGRVSLSVMDDGRGIDTERVARVAVEQKIVQPGRTVTERQALRLIFRPGFTTALGLSQMSGRGVGLEVVERAVEDWGGELRVRSRKGAGTTFEMLLPTTLALIPALVVRAGAHLYCVDERHVLGTFNVAPSDAERVNGETVMRWRGTPLPLVGMHQLLGQDETPRAAEGRERLTVVVSHFARREGDKDDGQAATRAGVVVDEVEGQREVLVRSLGRHATRWRGVNGATELHDGTVALLLDLPRLLEMTEQRNF